MAADRSVPVLMVERWQRTVDSIPCEISRRSAFKLTLLCVRGLFRKTEHRRICDLNI